MMLKHIAQARAERARVTTDRQKGSKKFHDPTVTIRFFEALFSNVERMVKGNKSLCARAK
jgi:hypothetical protein